MQARNAVQDEVSPATPPAGDTPSAWWDRMYGELKDTRVLFGLDGDDSVKLITRYHVDILRRFVNDGSRVLDVGCGSAARLGVGLGPHIGEYLGIDVSRRAVERGTEAIRKAGVANATLRHMTGPIPYAASFDTRFDLICVIYLLPHYSFWNGLVLHRALRELLAPGGAIAVGFANLDRPALQDWLAKKLEAMPAFENPCERPMAARPISRHELDVMMQLAGLRIETSFPSELPRRAREWGYDGILSAQDMARLPDAEIAIARSAAPGVRTG